jgi:hypothetical protein
VSELRDPPVASAAEKVAANVRTALSNIRTLHAERTEYFKVVKGPPRSEWQPDWTTADWWARARIYSDAELKVLSASGEYENSSSFFPAQQIVVSADGRWRKDSPENGPDNPPVIVDQYSGNDAAGVMKTYWPADGTLHVTRDTSLGPPDDDMGEYAVELSVDFIRPANLAAMADGRVGKTTFRGRPSLTVSCAIAPQPIEGLNMDSHLFDTVEFTVDRETWLVVRTSYLLRGEVVWEQRLTNVRVNRPVADAQFEPTCPRWTTTSATSLHFRRVSFGEAANAFSTPPLAPRALPDEFRPFAAAVAATAKFSYFTYTNGDQEHYWPPSRDVTQLSYRAGLLQFVVTTRTQPAGDPLPADPFVADPFVRESAGDDVAHTGQLEPVELSGGAWRGVTAYLVTPLLGSPHLWAWHDGTLITVAGDLARSELLSVVNSLEPME